MIKFRYGAAGVALAAALGMASAAQAADNADATATAEVLSALTLTNNTGLDFGGMVLTGVAGTVTLPASGAQTFDCDGGSGNIVCSGTTGLATFSITGGTVDKFVKINLPAGDTVLQHNTIATADAQHQIVLNGLDSDATFVADVAGDYYEVQLDAVNGEADFAVGGTINLDGDEVPGVYEGTFNVSVEYS